MNKSALYNVYDHKEKKYILKNVETLEIVNVLGIPASRVPEYVINKYKYHRRYSIERIGDEKEEYIYVIRDDGTKAKLAVELKER